MNTRVRSGMVEYEVQHPGVPGSVLWCHPCVLSVACAHCKSAIGVPCIGTRGFIQTTHYMRRYLFTFAKRNDFTLTDEQWAKFETRYGYSGIPRTIVRPPEPVKRAEFIDTFPHVKYMGIDERGVLVRRKRRP